MVERVKKTGRKNKLPRNEKSKGNKTKTANWYGESEHGDNRGKGEKKIKEEKKKKTGNESQGKRKRMHTAIIGKITYGL